MSEYSKLSIVPITLDEIHRSYAMRRAVFVKEQGYPPELEIDE